MSDDDFYYKMDREHSRASKLNSLRTKLDRGEDLTREEHAEIMIEEWARVRTNIIGAMNDRRDRHHNPVLYTQGSHDAVNEAVGLLIGQMMARSLVHSEKRRELEKRISRLEGELRSLRQPASASGPKLVSDSAGLRLGRAS